MEVRLFIAHQCAHDMVVDALPRRSAFNFSPAWAADIAYHAAMTAQAQFAFMRVAELRKRGEL